MEAMTICNGCGMAGTKESGYFPPAHKCMRWNTEFNILNRIASIASALISNDTFLTSAQLTSALKIAIDDLDEEVRRINGINDQ
jgi:hypothetical protein